MAVNALQYVKNVGKSFGYSAIDALKEYNPQITALASGAKDLSSELYDTIEDFKGKIKGTDDSDEKGLFGKARNTVKDYHDNLMADLKSGNWYNKERINEVEEQTMKDVFGFDDSDFDLDDLDNWDFDLDDEEETEVEEADSTTLITSTQKQTANAIIETMDAVGSKSTNAIANATVRSADYVAMSQKQSSKAIYSLNQKGFAQVSTGIAAINANISTLVTLGEPLTTHMQNSATFYTQSTEYQKSVLEKLDEIVGLIKPEETSKSSKKSTRLGDLITSEGVLDLTGYFDFVKGNINESMSEVTDMLDMVGGLDNLLKSLTSSPMKTATDAITRLLIPNVVQSSMEQFNQSLASFFPAMMDRMQSTTFGGIFDSLKDFLFPKRDFKQEVDTSEYKHGKVDWTGESEMALKEVIPTYLAAITSALTGGPMTQYDYKRGAFVTINGVKNLNDSRMSRQAKYAGGDFRSDALAAVRALNLDKDSEQYLVEGIENYFLNAFKNGANSATKIKNDNFNYKEYGMNEESLVLLREILQQYEDIGNTYVANQFASDIRLNQEQYSDEMRRIESEGGVERALFNNSDVLLNGGKTQAKGAGGIIGTDKDGNDIFFYLRGIYSYTGRLANNYHLFGVSVPTDNTEVTSGDLKLWLPNSGTEIPNNNPQEKKEASKQLSEIQDTLKKRVGNETTADVIKNSVRQQSDWRGDHRKPGQKKLEEAEKQQREKEEMEALGLRYNLTEEQQKSLADTLKEAEYGNGPEGYFNKIRDNVTKLFSMPGEAFASILSAGERSMYNLIFGKEGSKEDDGLFGYFYKKADSLFDKFDDYFGKKMGFSLKEWAKQFFNSDFATDTRDELKDAYKWLGSKVSDFTGFKGAGKTEELTLVGNTGESESATPAAINDFAGIQLDARGRRVTKTGVVAVSEGELIIPSDYNPYYHGSNNKQWQLANENRARNQFYGNFAEGGTVGETTADGDKEPEKQTIRVKTNAKGMQHYVENKGDKPEYYLFDDVTGEFYTSFDDKYGLIPPAIKKRCKKLPLQKGKNEEYDENVAWTDEGNLDIGRTKRNYSTSRMSEGKDDVNLFNILKSGVYKAVNSVQDAVNTYFPKDKKEEGILSKYLDKAQTDALKEANIPQEAINNKGAMGAGALIGAGASLLTGAVVGPFAGAAIGAGVGLIVKSDAVQKALFGDYEVDKDGKLTSTRSGGLLSKDVSNFIEKNVPSMATGATIGGVAGMFMGSPILGAIVGSAVGYATKSDAVKDALFGKVGKDGTREDSGIISKHLQDSVKKALPNIGAGALAGFMFGPFGGVAGIVGNVVLGSALGYASSSEEFKDILLGKPDKNGKRQGGIAGDLKGIFFGYEKNGKQKEGIVESVVGIFRKVGNEIRIDSRNLLKTAGESLQKLISGSLGNTFTQWLNGTRTGRFIGGAARTVGRAAYGIATAPLRGARAALQGVNNVLDRRSLKRGFNVVGSDGKMMTGGERLEEAERVGLSGDDYRLSAYDESLSNIESREDLDALLQDFDQVQNPELQYAGRLHNQRVTISHLLSRYRVDSKKALKILKAIDNEDIKGATKLIKDLKLAPEQEQRLLEELGAYSGTMEERGNAQSDAQAARERILERLGLTSSDIDLNDRNEVDKLKDLAKAEGKRLPELTEEEKKELEDKKKAEEAEERQKQDSENLGVMASTSKKLEEVYDEETKALRMTQAAAAPANAENPAKEAVDNTEGKPKSTEPKASDKENSESKEEEETSNEEEENEKEESEAPAKVGIGDRITRFIEKHTGLKRVRTCPACGQKNIPYNEKICPNCGCNMDEYLNSEKPKILGGEGGESGEESAEPQKKTIFNMFGDAIQKVRNKQGEWVDDTSDTETKESLKSNQLMKTGLNSLGTLGATIGGAFNGFKKVLFGDKEGEGKNKGILGSLFDKFFGEGSYNNGIFGILSSLFGGSSLAKLGKGVLNVLKTAAPTVALGALIAGAVTGKFDDFVDTITGGRMSNKKKTYAEDSEGNKREIQTDDDGNLIKNDEGEYLLSTGEWTDNATEDVGSDTSLSAQLGKNFVTQTLAGGSSVLTTGVKALGTGVNKIVKTVTGGTGIDDVASAASAVVAENGGILNTIMSGINKFLQKIPELMARVPLLSDYADKAQYLVDELYNFFSENIAKKIADSKMAKALNGLKDALQTAAPYLRIAVAAAAALNGAGEAEQYFEVLEATTGQRVVAALVAGLNAFIPKIGNIIPNKMIIEFLVKIAPHLGIDMSSLEQQQAELQSLVADYNANNEGDDLTTEEYLESVEHKGGYIRKLGNGVKSAARNVKDAASRAWNSAKNFLGIGSKEEENSEELAEQISDNGENAEGNPYTKSGLATVSEGELIVSAKDNPLSGKLGGGSKLSDLLGEALATAKNLSPFDEANVRETLSSHGVAEDKIDKAVDKINNLKGTAENIANDVKGIISDSITEDGRFNVSAAISNTADLFTGKMSESDNGIISTIGNVASTLKNAATDENGRLSARSLISNTIDSVTGKMSESDNGIISTIGNVTSGIKNTATNITGGIKNAATGILGSVGDALTSSTDEDGNTSISKFVSSLFGSLKGNSKNDDALESTEDIEEQDEELEDEYEEYEKAIEKIQKAVKNGNMEELLKAEYKGDEDSPMSGLFSGMFNIQKLYNAAYELIAQPFESTGGGSGNSSSSSSSNSNSSSSSASASETVEESSGGWLSKIKNGFKSFFNIGSGSGLKNQVGGDSGTDERFVSQTDDKYKNIKYANSKIGDVGCGPAAATMMINNAQPGAATMRDAIKLAKDYESPGGTNSGYFEYALGQYGLPTEYIDASTEKGNKNLRDQIANGQPAVLLGRDSDNKDKSSSPFGPSEHYVVATGMDNSGNVIINDPEARRGGIKYNRRILNNVSLGITGTMSPEATDEYKSSEGGAANVSDTAYAQAVWGYLTSRGYSPQAAAGIMGNMYQESGVNPTVIQGNGKGPAAGIVQWENYNNKSKRWGQMNEYAQSIGKDWTDLDTQLKFMDAEFTGEFKDEIPQAETWVANLVKKRYGSIEGFKNLNDITEATKGFEETFEQAGKPAMQNRYDAANAYYNLYNGSPYTGVYDGSIISGTSDGTTYGTSSSSSGVSGVLDSIKNIFKSAFAPLLGSSDSTSSGGVVSANSGLSGISGLGGEGTEQQQQLIKVLDPYVGTLKYDQNGYRNPEKGTADCSSTVNWAYKKVVGDSIGDDTLSILNSSKTTFVDTPNPGISKTSPAETSAGPNINNLEPGDLMLYSNPSGGSNGYCADRPYRVGHVEMYAGNGQRIGHGSDGGPRYSSYDTNGTKYIGAKRYNPFIEAEQNKTTTSNTTTTTESTNQNVADQAAKGEASGSGLGNVHMPSVSKMTGGGSNATKKSKLRRFSGGASGVDEEDETINTAVATNAETRRAAKEAKDANNEIISLLKTIAKAVQSIATNTEDIPKLGDTLTDYCQAQLATSVAEVKATAASNDNGKIDPSEDAALRDLMNTLGAIARG